MKIDLNQKWAELQAVDWNDFSAWPFFIKLTGVFLICVAILVGGFYFSKQFYGGFYHAENK